jgi:hypothetical protein
MHKPLFEGTAGMNVVSRDASMVLTSEVGLYVRCSIAFGTSHLRTAVMEVVVLGLFGVWFEAQFF